MEIERAFKDYNTVRLHYSIGYYTPREFRRKFQNDDSFRNSYLKMKEGNREKKEMEVETNGS
jgi:hypothetical protein